MAAWRGAWGEAFAGAGRAWLFVFKAVLAVCLTGWLAMRFDLVSPYEAMITCAIVINPASGMVVAKSFYRALGTLVGCGAAVLLVLAFPQQRALLLTGMALWLGVCAGGASLHRNFKSYGFVLAGYTAAIVILPVLDDPSGLFDSAVMRVSEVMLGILVAGVVSDAIAPQRLSRALRANIRAGFTGFVGFVCDSLAGVLQRGELEQAHLRFVRESVEIENLRSSVIFEDAGVRVRSPRTRRLNQRFMAASTSYQSLHHLMNRLQGDEHTAAREALMTIFVELAGAIRRVDATASVARQAAELVQSLDATTDSLQMAIGQARASLRGPIVQLDFDTGAELTRRFAAELRAYAQAYVDLAGPTSRHIAMSRHERAFAHGNDWLGAATIALRVVVVMLVTGWFWIATAWPGGSYAMLMAAIFCGLMASSPNPLGAVRLMWRGWVLGALGAFVCLFAVMPRMDGFVLFVAGLLPFLIAGFYPYTRPALAPIARSYVLSFLIMTELDAVTVYDVPAFFDRAAGLLLGVALTGVAFRLFANAADNRFLYRRLLDKLRAEVTRACRAPLAGARERLESASRDLFMQIIGYTGAGSHVAHDFMAWGLSVGEAGRAVVDLRADMAGVAPPLRHQLQLLVEALAGLYDAPGRLRYLRTRRRLASALRVADRLHETRVLRHLHLLRLALLDRQSVLAQYMLNVSDEVRHAA
ncbi:MAG TPA: FUSC family protein [Rhodanobacteraceae bacterium]